MHEDDFKIQPTHKITIILKATVRKHTTLENPPNKHHTKLMNIQHEMEVRIRTLLNYYRASAPTAELFM